MMDIAVNGRGEKIFALRDVKEGGEENGSLDVEDETEEERKD
jgi:hypothetical protein